MNIIRNIIAVIAGYMIFAVSAVMLFKFSGIDPHIDLGIGTLAIVIVFGSIFAFVGGYVTKWLAATTTPWANYALAFIIAAFAGFSLLKSPGSHYTQIAAIFLFAPFSLAGGLLRHNSEI